MVQRRGRACSRPEVERGGLELASKPNDDVKPTAVAARVRLGQRAASTGCTGGRIGALCLEMRQCRGRIFISSDRACVPPIPPLFRRPCLARGRTAGRAGYCRRAAASPAECDAAGCCRRRSRRGPPRQTRRWMLRRAADARSGDADASSPSVGLCRARWNPGGDHRQCCVCVVARTPLDVGVNWTTGRPGRDREPESTEHRRLPQLRRV